MINTLKLLLFSQLKYFKVTQKNSGFTLIELLVAMVLAGLVITPLLTFMINIMESDQREQAKAISEQQLHAALDYIARDLKQAVYIYDDDGLTKNNSANPTNSGIKDQIPPIAPANGCNDASKCQPIIVFWKREHKEKVVPVSGNTAEKDDTFVYSLVGYYLIKNDNNICPRPACIGRFQIEDGVKAFTSNGTVTFIKNPDNGFNLFNLSLTGNSLKVKMNQWQKGSPSYNNETRVLLDYIDQSTVGVPPPVNCSAAGMRTVPPDWAVNNTFKTYSFYACVDSSKTLAQVYLRGNALARIKDNATYSASDSAYFPQASIQVQGRGFLEAR